MVTLRVMPRSDPGRPMPKGCSWDGMPGRATKRGMPGPNADAGNGKKMLLLRVNL